MFQIIREQADKSWELLPKAARSGFEYHIQNEVNAFWNLSVIISDFI